VVIGLAVTLVLASLAHQAFPATWVLYTKYRFAWTPEQNGLSLALVGLTAIIVQGGLTGIVISKIGERRAVTYGMALSCFCFVLYGLATQGWMFYCIILFGAIAGVATPAIQALISHQVPLNEQGAVQGALTSLQSLTAIAGPILATHLFGYFISEDAPVHVPGAAFFFGSILVAAATINVIRCLRRPEFKATRAPDQPIATD
jgi:DHA1 family tetracycline resistance protein-like MFS transporter